MRRLTGVIDPKTSAQSVVGSHWELRLWDSSLTVPWQCWLHNWVSPLIILRDVPHHVNGCQEGVTRWGETSEPRWKAARKKLKVLCRHNSEERWSRIVRSEGRVGGEFGEGPQKVDPSTWRRAFVKGLELQWPEEQLLIGHLGGRVKFQHGGYYTLKAVYSYCRGSYLFLKFNVVSCF